jgi:hypothetical protein
MKTFVLTALFFLPACSSLPEATTAVNDQRALLDVSRQVIDEQCVPAYHAVQTSNDLARVDAFCLGPVKAYRVARASWVAAVSALLLARSTGDQTALLRAWQDMIAAGITLAAEIGKMR